MDLTRMEEILNDQRESFLKRSSGTVRDVNFDKYLKHPRIVVISGVRRAGKSTLLKQFSEKIENFHFANFDDERLFDFGLDDFQTMMLAFHKRSSSKNIILDEIQNIAQWERFVRRIHDEGYKVFLTGSNAKLLSSELGTHLTGRYVKIKLFPFSFREFLEFKGTVISEITTEAKARILVHFDDFLKNGGFPEYLLYKEPEFLKRTYDDIIYRDIITRHGIRNVRQFKQLSHYLFSNFTKDLSYNSLKIPLGFSNITTLTNYIHYLEESYLLFELFSFDYSVKKQRVRPKKIYAIDNKLRNVVSFSFSKDNGNNLENLIFLELKRRGQDIYFYREKGECDFVILDRSAVIHLIQVTFALDKHNRRREIAGIAEAMENLNCNRGTIITVNQDELIHHRGKEIKVVPAWRWLLESNQADMHSS
ncbi:ATP-binding protein [Candidatus Fermentibacteria bacterium]|nr:MAG: ATP-binding protein [Candidatus Fermentibacteria bacterium]